MFDLFYYGPKPDLFAFEKPAASLDDAAARAKTSHFWYIYGGNDYTGFNFDYTPVPWENDHLHVWPTQHQQDGEVYLANKATVAQRQWHYRTEQSVKRHVDRTIFFIDKHNPLSQNRADRLKDSVGNITTVRYVNSMLDTIKRCARKSQSRMFWVVSSENEYDEFDFTWHPDQWQQNMTHVFGSKWNKWSDTFLIDKFELEKHTEWAKSIEEFPNLNFVDTQIVKTGDDSSAMYYVDHSNPESESQFRRLRGEHPEIIKTRYANDYLSVLKRIMSTANTEYVWVLNSVCDYSQFDFSWQPEPWQKEMIHCFANDHGSWSEQRGDTFYIHVESFKNQMVELELLDWFNVINYVETQDVNRWPSPVVEYNSDNLIQAIKDYEFTTPYAVFANREFGETERLVDCLWTEKDRWCRPISTSSGISIIPRDIKKYLKTQVYDYPYLWKYEKGLPFNYYSDYSLDVIYISNGEPDAERWYEHLKEVLSQPSVITNYPRYLNKLQRVENVNGRVAAYQAAARASTTPWFFAVFAKLEVDHKFDFSWQPDYWQEPKHYIFNAKNPVNGLEYGHQAMIAYNKRLVLENNNPGIDFTLSQPHESVPILSGTAHYNQDPWTTWRTAFREVIKLRMFMETSPTIDTEHRLDVWLNKAEGKHSYHSLVGARDAGAYYDEVNGDPEKLQLSFDWAWLRTRFKE